MDGGIKKAIGALTMAIRIEQNGYRFYRRAAAETNDPKAKDLFNGLAEDEGAHESILRTRLDALEKEVPGCPSMRRNGRMKVSRPETRRFFPRSVSKKACLTTRQSSQRCAWLT
mgnify:CR=1 FL=1